MTDLKFSLFFAALLVGYLLVHLRMIRFEEHLQKLAGIRAIDDRLRTLDDRVKHLAEASGKGNLDRVSAQLDKLHEDLEDLREATIEVRSAVVQIPAPTVVAAVADDGSNSDRSAAQSESPATRIVAMIETRLLQLGYHNLRLLGDLSDVQMADEIEVHVEGERNGMPFKGRVIMRNGSVHDVNLQSVAQAFP
ncbi:MAG: hypothetical protein ACI90M_002417 [Candidatus Azotimanducaceae bacterium]|jgi:hypothetical protein